MYIFILLHTDGHVRCELLGITDEMYDDKILAKKWYENIVSEITRSKVLGFGEDNILNTEQSQAISKLDDLYKTMIECDDDEGDE